MMKNLISSANEPVTDIPYFECLDSVMERSRVRIYIHTTIECYGVIRKV